MKMEVDRCFFFLNLSPSVFICGSNFFDDYFAQISPSPKLNQRVVVVLRWV